MQAQVLCARAKHLQAYMGDYLVDCSSFVRGYSEPGKLPFKHIPFCILHARSGLS